MWWNNLSERLSRWGFQWAGWADNRRGEWWLAAQLLLLFALLLPPVPAPMSLGLPWPLALRVVGAALVLSALILAAQALLRLGDSLTPLPEPMPGSALITEGPYRRCRHPLYQAILVCSFGVTLALGSLLHLALLLSLALVVNLSALGYRIAEGWDWGDCYWMVAITIPTIGYGEVHELSHAGRWVTVFSVVGGLLVVQLSIRSLLALTESGYVRQVRRRRFLDWLKTCKTPLPCSKAVAT